MTTLLDKIAVTSQEMFDKERARKLKELGWKPGHQYSQGYCDDEVDHSPQDVTDHKN